MCVTSTLALQRGLSLCGRAGAAPTERPIPPRSNTTTGATPPGTTRTTGSPSAAYQTGGRSGSARGDACLGGGAGAVDIGEAGSDVAGLGGTEPGEERQSRCPVAAGLIGFVGGVVGASEDVVRAGLLVAVSGLGGEVERGGELSPGLARSAGSQQNLADADQR